MRRDDWFGLEVWRELRPPLKIILRDLLLGIVLLSCLFAFKQAIRVLSIGGWVEMAFELIHSVSSVLVYLAFAFRFIFHIWRDR